VIVSFPAPPGQQAGRTRTGQNIAHQGGEYSVQRSFVDQGEEAVSTPQKQFVEGPAGRIAYRSYGDQGAPVVVMAHSILTSGMMWHEQGKFLAQSGFHAIAADTRGHGASDASEPPYLMEDLYGDTVALLDGLKIEQAHYLGLSLGAMSGFGLAIRHKERLLSACLCAGRSDAPGLVASVWDERIEQAARDGTGSLAQATIERWFGVAFVEAHAEIAAFFKDIIGGTSFKGFAGCARAIQKLDFIGEVHSISVPVTLVVGSNDGVLPDANRALAAKIPGAQFELIANAGHLPNIDQPEAFNRALLTHLQHADTK
jgi:3-oxoadipate enol-lactonase